MKTLSLSSWKKDNYFGEEIENLIENLKKDAIKIKKQIPITKTLQKNLKKPQKFETIEKSKKNLSILKATKKKLSKKILEIEEEEQKNSSLLKSFKKITENSNNILKEKNNLETLTIEIESIIKFSISHDEYNTKTNFLDNFSGLNDFYKYNDKLLITLQKTIKGYNFFNTRINYKDSQIQIYRYNRILERLKIIFKNLFRNYYSEYFEILNKLFSNKKNFFLVKEEKFFLSSKLEDFDVENIFIVLLLYKFPLFFREYLKKGFLTKFFEGENSEGVCKFKKVAMNMTLNLDYHSGFAIIFEKILKICFENNNFLEMKKEIQNFYFRNYFQIQLEIFENIFGFIDNPNILAEIVILTIIEIISNSITVFDEDIIIEKSFEKNIMIFFDKINKIIFLSLKKIKDFNEFCEKISRIIILLEKKDFDSLINSIKTEKPLNLKKYSIYISKFFKLILKKNIKNDIFSLSKNFLNSLIETNLDYAEYLLNKIIKQEFITPELLKEFKKNSFKNYFLLKENYSHSLDLILYLFPKIINFSKRKKKLENFGRIILRKGFTRIYYAGNLFKNDFKQFIFKIKNYHFLFQALKEKKNEFTFEFNQNFKNDEYILQQLSNNFENYKTSKIYYIFSDALNLIINREIFRLSNYYKKLYEIENDIKIIEREIKLDFKEFKDLCFSSLNFECLEVVKNLFIPFLLSNIQKMFSVIVEDNNQLVFIGDEELVNIFNC